MAEVARAINGNSENGEVPVSRRRHKVTRNVEERPASLELETDWTNTETKLVVLDFLSSQPIERLTARNEPKNEKRKTPGKVRKSSSDSYSHESYRNRYAKLAKSARPLRKQYSLRLKKDLDEYLKQRGKPLDDISLSGGRSDSVDKEERGFMHQRSYTEGETHFRKTKRRISDDLKKGITEFNQSRLRHVNDNHKSSEMLTENFIFRSKRHRPENLEIPFPAERRISPVLSPESQVAVRLELISQEIIDTYPNLFNEQISKVSLQDLTYEKFASTARKVLEKYPGGWTRVALVCYFARELALEDESTDEQLDNLVGFSSRFISETSAEWIASQGGWGALEENDKVLSPDLVRKKLKEEPDLVDGIVDGSPMKKWLDYVKYYGVAALAVGMTVVYTMTR